MWVDIIHTVLLPPYKICHVKQFQILWVSVSKVTCQKLLGVSKVMCQKFYSLLGVFPRQWVKSSMA